MKILLSSLLACILALPLCAATPDDIVPAGSGLYDAAALLAQEHLLPADAPDATRLQGVTARLYTRADFARWVRGVQAQPDDPRAAAALAFARNLLAPELGSDVERGPSGSTVGVTGLLEPEVRGQDDQGAGLRSRGNIFGRGRLLGTLGRDGAYTVSVTDLYRQTRDHASLTTRGGGDNPDVLNGVDEAYVTVLGRRGLRATVGLLRQRWGSGYRGEMLVSDNAPARPTLQIEFPFSLGARLGDWRFTQYLSTYRNQGINVVEGARRLEHPFGDRTTLSVEENYRSKTFFPDVLVEPFYANQKIHYSSDQEPFYFNYQFNAGLTVRPAGPSDPARVYGQFLIDDIKAPHGLGKGNNTPRKIGYLLGFGDDFPATGTDVVVEYARTDPQTYTKLPPYSAALALFDDGLPSAHPIGPNGQEVFARLGQRLGSRWDLSLDGRLRQRVSDSFPAPRQRALDAALSYRLDASRALGLRYTDYQEDPFPYPVPDGVSTQGGAAVGERLRRHVLALSFLQSF